MGLSLKTLLKKLNATRKAVSNNVAEDDLNSLSPNNLDPRTSKPILEVVLETDKFIVTIDNALSVNWMTKGGYKDYAKDFIAVTSKVQFLSVQIDQLFAKKANRYKYKKIIAEALALVLDEKQTGNALALLKKVENRIKEYGRERVRIAYIFYASLTTCLIGTLVGLLIYSKNSSWLFGGNVNLYRICITTLMGGVGAFISTFVRFKNYEGNTSAGLSAHRLDGFLRILYGCIAAFILGLAIYSNTILGFLNNANYPWVIYFLATIAGASEFLLPNLIRSTQTNQESGEGLIFEERETTDNVNIDRPSEDTMTTYGYTEKSDDILPSTQNEGHDKLAEENATGKDEQIGETIVYNSIENDADIPLYTENEKSEGRQDKEIKISGRLVQGKMNLQDY